MYLCYLQVTSHSFDLDDVQELFLKSSAPLLKFSLSLLLTEDSIIAYSLTTPKLTKFTMLQCWNFLTHLMKIIITKVNMILLFLGD